MAQEPIGFMFYVFNVFYVSTMRLEIGLKTDHMTELKIKMHISYIAALQLDITLSGKYNDADTVLQNILHPWSFSVLPNPHTSYTFAYAPTSFTLLNTVQIKAYSTVSGTRWHGDAVISPVTSEQKGSGLQPTS